MARSTRAVRFVRAMLVAALVGGGGASTLAGQGGAGLAERGPRFLVASPSAAGAPVRVDVSRTPVLTKTVSLDLDGATLGQALAAIRRESGLRLTYSTTVVPLQRIVHLKADKMTVAAALTEVLLDTGVDVLFSRQNEAVLMRRSDQTATPREATGIVAGRITDAKTGERIVGADVYLDGTKWKATTGDNGYYKIPDAEAGAYTLVARRVGYAKQTRPVRVVAAEEVTVDVALSPVVTQLNELVTTVTGEQRARELGHVIGRIDADSVVKEAPISTLSELLTARVPGLQVNTLSAVVGGTVSLQVRSPNSFMLSAEPIIIVDGVRYTNAATGRTGPGVREETSRLNDINPNDIETVEVVKGPSAATLYGTDAANGVLVITTKRGRSGDSRWNGYFRAVRTGIPKYNFPDSYWGWGTVYGTANAPYSCTLALIANGSCTQQDSIVRVTNPLNDPNYTFFHSEPSWEYGLNTSGGKQDFRYYFSADWEDATGPFQMPREAIERIKQARGIDEVPIDQLEPNATSRLNLRGNIGTFVAPKAELRISGGYSNGATRTIGSGSNGGSYYTAATASPTQPYGSLDPASQFALVSTEHLDRFAGSAAGEWRPLNAVQVRATVGVDLANTLRSSLARPGETTGDPAGLAMDDRSKQLAVTGDIGVSALARRGRATFRTSVGVQYARNLTNIMQALGYGLPPGGESAGQGSSFYLSQTYQESATLGGYVEETFGLNDRIFLTAAMRVDGATAFGRDYSAAVYPKAGLSWIVSDEPFMPRLPWLDELRLRYAFGASGKQATSNMSLADYGISNAFIDGQTVTSAFVGSIGNPELRPERVREHEFGFDAGALGDKLRLTLTWFKRNTTDPIIYHNLAPGLGGIYTNLGAISAHGFEAEINARPIESKYLSWQVNLTHSLRRSVLTDLGGQNEYMTYSGGQVKGYALGARFIPTIESFDDANHDGIIVQSEIQMGDPRYAGESTAPSTQTLTSTLGFFDRRIRVSGLFERRAGYTQGDEQKYRQCSSQCLAAIDPATPLAEQAVITAMRSYYNYRPVEDGTFVRFREFTLAADLPARLLRAMRVRTASLSFAIRNVALWSNFGGVDPESAPVYNYSGATASAIPQGRMYTLRMDLGL